MCKEKFEDETGVHVPGERWLVKGPKSYVPSVEETVLGKRERICLSDSEGIYVRNIQTGQIKMVTSTSYMLEAHEEKWEKNLSEETSLILYSNGTAHVDELIANSK